MSIVILGSHRIFRLIYHISIDIEIANALRIEENNILKFSETTNLLKLLDYKYHGN